MSLKMALGNKSKASTINAGTAANVVRYSDDFTNAAWTKLSGALVTANAATNPRGASTAQVVGDSNGVFGSPGVAGTMQVAVAAVGEVWTVSVFAKSKSGSAKRYVQVGMGAGVFTAQAVFDLEAVSVSSVAAGATARIFADVGGWLRLVVTGASVATGSGNAFVKLGAAPGMANYTGDGTSGVYLWRAQMERGAVATGEIPTTAAAASAVGFQASLPATNLRYEGRTKLARTAGVVGGAVVVGNLTSSLAGVQVVALWGHNLTQGLGVCTIELYTGLAQTGSLVYSTEVVAGIVGYPCIPMLVHWLPSIVYATSYRITWHDPSNAAGYVQAARVFVGEVFAPKWGADMGARMGWQDASTQRRLAGGGLRTSVGARYRRTSLDFGLLTETERHDLFYALGNWGRSTEVLFSRYAGEGGRKESDHAMLCKFVEMPDLQEDGLNAFSVPLVLEEA